MADTSLLSCIMSGSEEALHSVFVSKTHVCRIPESVISPFNGNEVYQIVFGKIAAAFERHYFIGSPVHNQYVICIVNVSYCQRLLNVCRVSSISSGRYSMHYSSHDSCLAEIPYNPLLQRLTLLCHLNNTYLFALSAILSAILSCSPSISRSLVHLLSIASYPCRAPSILPVIAPVESLSPS